jgi:hypothetical protein
MSTIILAAIAILVLIILVAASQESYGRYKTPKGFYRDDMRYKKPIRMSSCKKIERQLDTIQKQLDEDPEERMTRLQSKKEELMEDLNACDDTSSGRGTSPIAFPDMASNGLPVINPIGRPMTISTM